MKEVTVRGPLLLVAAIRKRTFQFLGSGLKNQFEIHTMLSSFTNSLHRILRYSSLSPLAMRASSSLATIRSSTPPPVAPEDMPYLHHGKRPRFRNYEKFRSPRRRASKLYHELVQEAIQKSKSARPAVWKTEFRVGDAIELENVEEGGVKAQKTNKFRGVVLGIFRKGLDHSVLIRDVVFGEPMETLVPLHSPLLRSIKVLEKNFVHKGKRKIKRAKLYYLSERNPLGMSFLILFCCCCIGFANVRRCILHCRDAGDKMVECCCKWRTTKMRIGILFIIF
jgi:large subunit ribosomal protein L19